MFGTLVVTLPSKFEGGDLVVRHNGQQHLFNQYKLGGESPGLSFVAFYADCEHEVKPVTKGYRSAVQDCSLRRLRKPFPLETPSQTN